MSARRPLLTATAAGSMLFALWFVPSANATPEPAKSDSQSRPQATQVTQASHATASKDLSLADTGSVDTTPYLVGGTFFLGFGAAIVATAARRSRNAAI
ncbi:hypothetical protein ABZW18_13650 [Streptomyces sp. NPDC004647]|uniref:hypothetical protein n=1 Tax=Streptomyces sp. NPDC004647 TaxID=3154671 RepID=UPI0033ADD4F2